MKEDKFELSPEIYDFAKYLANLYELTYDEIRPEVIYIISKNVKNVRYIESVLDKLLDIPTDKSYELYSMLCNYYGEFNMGAAKFYLDSWDEMYGKNKTKTKKKGH